MAVDDQDVIDLVSVDGSGMLVLTISDHLDWLDPAAHMVRLQEKINLYLAFVESGEMVDSYPNSEGRSVAIRIVFKYAPTADGVLFLERVGEALFRNNFEFRWSELT